MLRVYLDQNKWIDLARAATGNPKGERFRDALDMCRAASAAKEASNSPKSFYPAENKSLKQARHSLSLVRKDAAHNLNELRRTHR